MKKIHSAFLALLITLLIFFNISLFTKTKPIRETAIISRIIDGDTLQLKDGRIIRLLNINAPEKSFPNHEISINNLKLLENSSVELEIIGKDKYNRFLGRIYTYVYLNLDFVKKGLASKFLVDEKELSRFYQAEKKAIENQFGIWKRSPYFNCFESKIYPKEEIIILKNKCNKINISNWILKDESSKYYKFKDIKIGEITIHTKKGEDNRTDIFWNSKTNIWNNDRDTAYLFEPNGDFVHTNSYGY